MCSIWQKQNNFKEMPYEMVKKIFEDKIFTKNLKIINFTGGEPTLHPYFDKLIKLWADSCPELKRLDMPTNGLQPDLVKDRVQQALSLLYSYPDIRFTVTVSLDGIGEIYDRIRGVKGGFENVERTIKYLKELMFFYSSFSLSLNVVITKFNYNELEEVRKYAHREKLYLNYTLGAVSEIGVESVIQKDKFLLDDEQRVAVKKIIIELERKKEIDKRYANFLIHYLQYNKRKGGCNFIKGKALLLDADGKLYQCGNYKKFYMGDLTQGSFSQIQREYTLPKEHRKICKRCVSNCYWDER
jgi:MoaA/NifB/PqqE/SkfB family radical SAM enzyme